MNKARAIEIKEIMRDNLAKKEIIKLIGEFSPSELGKAYYVNGEQESVELKISNSLKNSMNTMDWHMVLDRLVTDVLNRKVMKKQYLGYSNFTIYVGEYKNSLEAMRDAKTLADKLDVVWASCEVVDKPKKIKFVDMDVKYINPFTKGKKDKHISHYERKDIAVFSLDGINYIVKVHDEQYDYVLNGTCITQRVGASISMLLLLKKYKATPKDYDLRHKINMEHNSIRDGLNA